MLTFAANTSWYLWNFRKSTIEHFCSINEKVVAIAGDQNFRDELEKIGCEFVHLPVLSGELRFKNLYKVYKLISRISESYKENIIFSFTPKVIFLSYILALMTKSKHVPNISGLGQIISRQYFLRLFYIMLLRICCKNADHVFFQNKEDKNLLNISALNSKSTRLYGSGVDLVKFTPTEKIGTGDTIVFGFFSRLIVEKGLSELVQALEAVDTKKPLKLIVAGSHEPEKKNNVPITQLNRWCQLEWFDYRSHVGDIRSELRLVDCVVLPSYYGEGMPKILLEAAAAGKPIITTDHPGCRDCVTDSSGILVQPNSVHSLREAIERFVSLSQLERLAMGREARKLAIKHFDVEKNILIYDDIYKRQK